MDKILNLLYRIKEKPAVFLGRKTLDGLPETLSGYILGIYDCSCGDFRRFPNDFLRFVQKAYNEYRCAYYWDAIIRMNCNSDEEAFDKFYELLEIFLNESEYGTTNF